MSGRGQAVKIRGEGTFHGAHIGLPYSSGFTPVSLANNASVAPDLSATIYDTDGFVATGVHNFNGGRVLQIPVGWAGIYEIGMFANIGLITADFDWIAYVETDTDQANETLAEHMSLGLGYVCGYSGKGSGYIARGLVTATITIPVAEGEAFGVIVKQHSAGPHSLYYASMWLTYHGPLGDITP